MPFEMCYQVENYLIISSHKIIKKSYQLDNLMLSMSKTPNST